MATAVTLIEIQKALHLAIQSGRKSQWDIAEYIADNLRHQKGYNFVAYPMDNGKKIRIGEHTYSLNKYSSRGGGFEWSVTKV